MAAIVSILNKCAAAIATDSVMNVMNSENLKSVTGLQRHSVSSEESVGGPVNETVITKDEGFRWASSV